MSVIQIHRDASSGAIERVPFLRVYVKSAWTSKWRPVDYLEPLTAAITSGAAIGRATFRYRSGRIKRADRTALENYPPQWLARQFVKIVRLLDGPADDSAGDAADRADKEELLWIGLVDDQQFALHGTDAHKWTMDATLIAYDLRILLQRQRLADAWARDSIIDNLVRLKFMPTFNLRASRAGGVAGNAALVSGDPGTGELLFGNSLGPTFWNNRQIVDYLLNWHGPHVDPSTNGQQPGEGGAAPFFVLGGQTVLPQHVVGVYALEGRSLLEAMGVLMDRRRGMGWCLVTDGEPGSKVEVRAFSLLDQDLATGLLDVAIPANADPVELDLSTDRAAQQDLVVSESQSFERVRVVGQRIKSCFTVSFADGTLEKNWADDQEVAYKTPGGADAAENDRCRGADLFERVFSHFRIPRNWDWMAGPGWKAGPNPGGGSKFTANPSCDAQGTLRESPAGPTWTEGLTFLRQLPLEADDGWKDEEIPAGSRAELAPPFAMIKRVENGTTKWYPIDRLSTIESDDGTHLPNGSLRMLDTELGLAVRFHPRHLVADGHWGGADETKHEPSLKYEDLLATVAVETPVRLEVVRATGILKGTGRELVIEVPDAEAWWIVPNTVVGQKADGSLKHAETCHTVHTDADRLRKIAALACAYYGRPRSILDVTLRRIVSTPAVGSLVKRLSGAVTPTVGTAVSSLEYDFQRFATRLRTEFAELDLAAQGGTQILFPGQGLPGSLGRSLEARLGDVERRVGRLPDREALPSPARSDGFWARLKTEGSAAIYTARRLKDDAETDADAEAADLENVVEVNGVSGIPTGETGTVVWVRPDTTDDPAEWRFACPIFPPESGETDQGFIFDSEDGKVKWVDLEAWECPEPE